MRVAEAAALLLFASWAVSCSASAPPPPAAEAPAGSDVPEVTGAAGGSDDDSLGPNQLTGVLGIDKAQDLDVRVLDARGTGRLGGSAIAVGPLAMGQWMLTDPGSEYEITMRSSLMPDGIIRLNGQSALLIEPPVLGPLPKFRVFGGQAMFYMPHLPPGEVTILTPAGPLFTRGAVFSVTVSPDFQVLVTCREGAVYLTGNQNAVAQPGQVLVGDRLGRNHVYAMTPNEAQVFADRWLQVMTEEAAPVDAAALPQRLAAWKTLDGRLDPEQAQFLALWFREAKTVLGPSVPGPETWNTALLSPVRPSPWQELPPGPGLLGESP
jgi:hypothetical protein